MRNGLIALFALSLLASATSAQCPGGVCSLASAPRARVVVRQTAEPPLARAVAAPVRVAVAVTRPVRVGFLRIFRR
jgi:hypothetical protein